MKETPIIMSGNHPKLILNDLKMQTRRVIKPQPIPTEYSNDFAWKQRVRDLVGILSECPYGQVGDRLWVRETFVLESDEEYGSETLLKDRPIKEMDDDEGGHYHLIPHYQSTEPEPNIVTAEQFEEMDDRTKWRPSIHMPRWASRILLEITEVRLERIREISDEDCIAEGVNSLFPSSNLTNLEKQVIEPIFYKGLFETLWDSLNAKRDYGWEVNPWVWAISFKVVK